MADRVVVSGGRYHNWIPKEQFDRLDQAGYQQLIHDRVARGEVQANNTETASVPPATLTSTDIPTPAPPALSVHIPPTDNPSVLTGAPTASSPNPHNNARSASMAIVTPRLPNHGSTTSTQMDYGPHTLLRQLMSNASARTNPSHASNLQGRCMNYIYRITHQERVPGYMGKWPGVIPECYLRSHMHMWTSLALVAVLWNGYPLYNVPLELTPSTKGALCLSCHNTCTNPI